VVRAAYGSERFAVTAPGREELNEDGLVAADIVIEVRRVQHQDIRGRYRHRQRQKERGGEQHQGDNGGAAEHGEAGRRKEDDTRK
jgi:hypothetical protein